MWRISMRNERKNGEMTFLTREESWASLCVFCKLVNGNNHAWKQPQSWIEIILTFILLLFFSYSYCGNMKCWCGTVNSLLCLLSWKRINFSLDNITSFVRLRESITFVTFSFCMPVRKKMKLLCKAEVFYNGRIYNKENYKYGSCLKCQAKEAKRKTYKMYLSQ